MRTILQKTTGYYITFDYSQKVQWDVMRIPGIFNNKQYKRYEAPLSSELEVRSLAQKWAFDFILSEKKSVECHFEMPELTTKIPLRLSLYDYQRQGVAYIGQKGSSIIGDAPGLGKTAQAIAAVIAANAFPCLVICPASLKLNWVQEWHLWSQKRACVLTKSYKNTWPVLYDMGIEDVFVCNYESLRSFFATSIIRPKGEKLRWDKHIRYSPNISRFKSVIIDESHRVKDASTIQSKMAYGITRSTDLVLALSGTPIVNRPMDLLTQLLIINKIDTFGGVANFKAMALDEERWSDINLTLRNNCYFRREKKEVLTSLPDKTRNKVLVEITTQKEYDTALVSLETYLREYKSATNEEVARALRAEIIVRMGKLKEISAKGKIEAAKEFIDDVLESGEKIVVFIYLTEVARQFAELYPDALFFTGGQSKEDRDYAINEFQKCTLCGKRFERHDNEDHDFAPTDKKIIFVNYKTGGVGITLTAASTELFIEMPWHAADTDQCEDRCHRISQKNAVDIHYFIGQNTFDETVYDIINSKREMAGECTGAIDETQEIEKSLFDLLVSRS